MMKKIEEYSLCVKICLFLYKNHRLNKEELLYLISLSDFYYDNSMKSKNIKNINSLTYYTNILNKSIAILFATKLISYCGESFELTASGNIFSENVFAFEKNKFLIEKIEYISSNYNCKDSLVKIYEEMVSKFIINKLGGEE